MCGRQCYASSDSGVDTYINARTVRYFVNSNASGDNGFDSNESGVDSSARTVR